MPIDRIHTIFNQNVSPDAHVISEIDVISCKIGGYGIVPRDT